MYMFGFGPGFFTNLNASGPATVFSAGKVWAMSDSFDLMGTVDLGLSFKHTDVFYLSPQLKGRYFFKGEEENTTFVGLGLGYGMATSHEDGGTPNDTAQNFNFSASYGYKAFRGSSMELSIAIEHQIIFDEATAGTPLLTFLTIGVYFDSW